MPRGLEFNRVSSSFLRLNFTLTGISTNKLLNFLILTAINRFVGLAPFSVLFSTYTRQGRAYDGHRFAQHDFGEACSVVVERYVPISIFRPQFLTQPGTFYFMIMILISGKCESMRYTKPVKLKLNVFTVYMNSMLAMYVSRVCF